MAAQVLARHFGTLDAIASASLEQITAVRGLGAIIGEGVVSYFWDPGAKRLIAKLRKAGVNFIEPRQVAAGGALAGKTVVITGTLPTLTRTKATEAVEAAGGRVTNSVSKRRASWWREMTREASSRKRGRLGLRSSMKRSCSSESKPHERATTITVRV